MHSSVQVHRRGVGCHGFKLSPTQRVQAEGGLADSAAEAQVADLRMAVSKRNAEVDFLEAELAKVCLAAKAKAEILARQWLPWCSLEALVWNLSTASPSVVSSTACTPISWTQDVGLI